MKKKLTHSVLTLFCVLFTPLSVGNETIRLTSGEWPPYLSEQIAHGGFATHVVSEAFRQVGVNVEYGYYPWKRSYSYALKGVDGHGTQWHGTIVWIKTEERKLAFYYSDPVVVDDEVLFYLKQRNLNWESIEDLKGLTIGGTAHTAYPTLEEAVKQGIITLERGGNYDALLKRIMHKKIDAAPLVKHVGFYYLISKFQKMEALNFSFSPTVIETREYHLILSKRKPENKKYIELFNQGLKQIRENGTYDALHDNLVNGVYYYP